MNITGMSTISSHIKNMNLNMKWQQRKQDPLKDKELDPKIAEIKRWSEEQRRGQTISSIHGKMLAGGNLTKQEIEYLRENNPEMYKKAVQIKEEREQYKKELENCKSKEDVEKLNQRKLHQFATEAKAISNNPNIPEEKKRELLEFLSMRMNAMMNDHAEFIQSKEYHQLPDKTDEREREDNSVEIKVFKDDNILTDNIENNTTDPSESNKISEPVSEKADDNGKPKKSISRYA